MDVPQIEAFLRAAGCDKIRVRSEWVVSTCPLAFQRHAGGRDEHPSFGILIAPGGESRCRCFACEYHGPLYPIAYRLNSPRLFALASTGNLPDMSSLPDAPVKRASGLTGRIDGVPPYWMTALPPTRVGAKRIEVLENEVLPESLLEAFYPLPDYVRDHLVNVRNIHPDAIEKWGIGYHVTSKRIAIPIRNVLGQLVAISGRAFGDQQPKYLHSRFKRDAVLYGEHLPVESETAYLCEGFFQAIALWQNGYTNPFARMGTHLSRAQQDRLCSSFREVVIVPDGDKAGLTSAVGVAEALRSRVLVRIADMDPGKDADTVTPQRLRELVGPSTIRVDNRLAV